MAEPLPGGEGPVLARIAHDLRTPLAGLLALVDLLGSGTDGPLAPAQRSRLRRIRSAAERIAGVADQVAELARVQAGAIGLRPARFDFEQVARLAMRDLEVQARSRAVCLRVRAARNLPGPLGDATRIRQLLALLVSNALRQAEGTSLELQARPRGAAIEVTLREGPGGIPLEALPGGLEPSGRSPAGLPEPALARDVGLSIASGLARLHGGSLQLAEGAADGLLATLTLPAGPAEPASRAARRRDLRPRT